MYNYKNKFYQCRDLIPPEIAKLGQKYENLNNIAIMWQFIGGIFYPNSQRLE